MAKKPAWQNIPGTQIKSPVWTRNSQGILLPGWAEDPCACCAEPGPPESSLCLAGCIDNANLPQSVQMQVQISGMPNRSSGTCDCLDFNGAWLLDVSGGGGLGCLWRYDTPSVCADEPQGWIEVSLTGDGSTSSRIECKIGPMFTGWALDGAYGALCDGVDLEYQLPPPSVAEPCDATPTEPPPSCRVTLIQNF